MRCELGSANGNLTIQMTLNHPIGLKVMHHYIIGNKYFILVVYANDDNVVYQLYGRLLTELAAVPRHARSFVILVVAHHSLLVESTMCVIIRPRYEFFILFACKLKLYIDS